MTHAGNPMPTPFHEIDSDLLTAVKASPIFLSHFDGDENLLCLFLATADRDQLNWLRSTI